MCVTHGLISVNPRRHLIGHHVDWAKGFPFAAYGLPDLYQRTAPAVELFGFAYDEQFLDVHGGRPVGGSARGGGAPGERSAGNGT